MTAGAIAIVICVFLAGCTVGAAIACGALYVFRRRWPAHVAVHPQIHVDWSLIDAALEQHGLRAVPADAARRIAH
jgi:energy-converting hydrogenase Eha subunit G